MRKQLLNIIILTFAVTGIYAQKNVGIGTETPDPSAILELNVNDGTLYPTKMGLLAPRMTAAERDGILTPANGLLVYVTDTNPGFYYYNGTAWVKLLMSGSPVSGVAGGDLSGNYPDPSVAKLQGQSVSASVPTNNQALVWNGSNWAPTTILGGGGQATRIAFYQDANTLTSSADLTFVSPNNLKLADGNLTVSNGSIDLMSIAGQSAKEVKFYTNAGGANFASIKAADGMTSNVELTLPSAYPAAGSNYLVADATGNLSWAAAMPAGTVNQTLRHDATGWTANDFLYNTGTKLGIGNTLVGTPDTVIVDITGDTRITGDLIVTGNIDPVAITLIPRATDISGALPGTIYYNSTENILKVMNTSNAWNFINTTAYQLPATIGTAGQVLTAGADGTASWQTITGGGTPSESSIPAGAMMPFAGANAPDGWLLCDGSAVSRTGQYAALFAAIGTAYGAGDGSTTFNLPNLGGKFPMGANATNALGATGGAPSFTLDTANMPAHNHGIVGVHLPGVSGPLGYTAATSGGSGAALYTSDNPTVKILTPYTTSANERILADQTIKKAGGSNAGVQIPTIPPYTVTNYIIKF